MREASFERVCPQGRTGRKISTGQSYIQGRQHNEGRNTNKKNLFAEGFIDQEKGIFLLWIENIFQ